MEPIVDFYSTAFQPSEYVDRVLKHGADRALALTVIFCNLSLPLSLPLPLPLSLSPSLGFLLPQYQIENLVTYS